MDQRTDQELLCSIQAQSDRTALATLYDRYYRKVYALAYGILRSQADAEDILQEVFENVWKKAATFQSALGEPKYWLLRIAHNRSINLLKARAVRSRETTSIEGSSGGTLNGGNEEAPALQVPAEETPLPDFDIAESLQVALKHLPAEQRKLIELAFFKGYSHSEIAENENIPLGTVKTRIRNGILRLRSELEFLRN